MLCLRLASNTLLASSLPYHTSVPYELLNIRESSAPFETTTTTTGDNPIPLANYESSEPSQSVPASTALNGRIYPYEYNRFLREEVAFRKSRGTTLSRLAISLATKNREAPHTPGMPRPTLVTAFSLASSKLPKIPQSSISSSMLCKAPYRLIAH